MFTFSFGGQHSDRFVQMRSLLSVVLALCDVAQKMVVLTHNAVQRVSFVDPILKSMMQLPFDGLGMRYGAPLAREMI